MRPRTATRSVARYLLVDWYVRRTYKLFHDGSSDLAHATALIPCGGTRTRLLLWIKANPNQGASAQVHLTTNVPLLRSTPPPAATPTHDQKPIDTDAKRTATHRYCERVDNLYLIVFVIRYSVHYMRKPQAPNGVHEKEILTRRLPKDSRTTEIPLLPLHHFIQGRYRSCHNLRHAEAINPLFHFSCEGQ
jgi:hypothetical protein